jgi:hypothetical protein
MPHDADYAVKNYDRRVSPVYADGDFTFDRVNEYVDLGVNPIPADGEFSFSAWVWCFGEAEGRSDRKAAAFGSACREGINLRGIVVRRNQNDLWVELGDGQSTCRIRAIRGIIGWNSNKWHHIAIIYQPPRVSVYVNGREIAGKQCGYANAKTAFHIGYSGGLNVVRAHWYGKVRNLEIHDKSLSPSEIMTLFSKGSEATSNRLLKTFQATDGEHIIIYRLPII